MFFLVGPTAVGKSDMAVEIALGCNAEIVGADAFQIYSGLPLLTAQPGPEVRARVPHYLIGEIPASHSFDAAQYRELALARIREIESRGKRALVVGGTGLYIRALTHGLSEFPPADQRLREELGRLSTEELQRRYGALDPSGLEKIDRHNPRRLIRAIEVSLLMGRPYSSLRADWSGGAGADNRAAKIPGALLERDREDLGARIQRRVPEMFQRGVVEEVRAAGAAGPTARQAIGYAEIQAHLRGEMDGETCMAVIIRKTRQYAKRQLTWFRRQPMSVSLSLTHHSHTDVAASLVRRILSGTSP